MRRPRTTTVKAVKYRDEDSDLSFTQTMSSDDEDGEEWRPAEPKLKPSSRAARAPAAGEKKAAVKRTAKPREPKAPKEPRVPKEPKPRAPRKPAAGRKPQAPTLMKDPGASGLAGTKRKKTVEGKNDDKAGEGEEEKPTDCPEGEGVNESTPSIRMKEERVSFIVSEAHQTDRWADEGSSMAGLRAKKEEVEEEDFTFGEPCLKKQKTDGACQGQQTALSSSKAQALRHELNMNWDPIELLSTLTCVERWVCVNIIVLLREENTVPFMVRYRKEMINQMDADAVRDVQLVYDELCSLAKKTQSVVQTLKKDGVLTAELEQDLRSCRSADELDHVYSPYKKGSKLTKARRAKALGLEVAATTLMDTPHTLDLRAWVKSGTEGLSSEEEVATGVEHILADMIAKDPETLTYVKTLCENSFVTIQSSVSKSALKGKEQEKSVQSQKKPGSQQTKNKDIDKFHLYFDFTCNVQRIQPHQTLAINRGESLKILTVKVNVPDRVKSDFTRWCINNRSDIQVYTNTPTQIDKHTHTPFTGLCVEDWDNQIHNKLHQWNKLTSTAEKESIALFVRNLRQRLLVCPVRGCVMMGVDPGFRHGCKLAILSPTSQILHTDVVYLHNSGQQKEAEKLRHLMLKYSCTRVVIGNGTACRETESFFADLISRRFFHPLDLSYWAPLFFTMVLRVTNMCDESVRHAVCIWDLGFVCMLLVAESLLSLGSGTSAHDVSTGALKAALDGVVQECVSFVGVDINICSEMLMRHVAGLNAGRARNIAEWREQNGPFINREQLKLVKGMGPKTYQQCAGFIRINPQTPHSVKSTPHLAPAVSEKPVAKKGKGRACVNIPTSFNPLDQTCIHPESYHVAQRFLSIVGGSADQIGSAGLRQCVESKVKTSSVEELARTIDTTPETLKLIIDGLTQPPGFDIRQNFGQADFKRGVVSMSDLRVGAVLTGRVDNTTLFGAFVDIGVGRSGLIHKSNITLDKLPVSQRRRSLALGPGERVEVRVLNVDPQRGRIGLDLIRVLQ
ncbi:hypothetical protein PAMP_001444 [Pampus punctatissimus]